MDKQLKDVLLELAFILEVKPQNHSSGVFPPDQKSAEILGDSCSSNSQTQFFSFENKVLIFGLVKLKNPADNSYSEGSTNTVCSSRQTLGLLSKDL